MLNQRIGDHMATKVKYDLRQQVINKNSTRAIGEQMNILTESIDGIAPFFQSYLPQVFKSMMIPVAIIVAMLCTLINCNNYDGYSSIYSYVLYHFWFENKR